MFEKELVMSKKPEKKEDTIACPYCGEKILAVAKKCKHCGEIVDSSMRELDLLKSQKQSVFMNAGGGGSSASASASSASTGENDKQLKYFSHGWHLFFAVITSGVWIPFWFLLYLFRNKNVYY